MHITLALQSQNRTIRRISFVERTKPNEQFAIKGDGVREMVRYSIEDDESGGNRHGFIHDARTPVERLMDLKYDKSDPFEMVQGLQTGYGSKFNQRKTNTLSPTRVAIDETSLLKNLDYVSEIQANVYDEITKNQDDFFDALNEVIRAKSFPPGSVLPKIQVPNKSLASNKGITEAKSPISMIVRKSLRHSRKAKSTSDINSYTKKMKKIRKHSTVKKKKAQTLDRNKIYSNPYQHARLLQRAMDRRRKKEEQKFMKELAYLQQHILDEEKRRSQRVKDTRSAYTNAHKFYTHERKYLQNASRLRRANDADEAVKKVQHEKEVMAQRRQEAQAEKEDIQKKKAKQMKEEWARRKKEREDREEHERIQREQIEKEKRREWQLMRESERRKEERERANRERKEMQIREERRNQKYAQGII